MAQLPRIDWLRKVCLEALVEGARRSTGAAYTVTAMAGISLVSASDLT